MKLKKKTCGILAVLLLLMTVFTGMQEVSGQAVCAFS